MAQIRPVKLIHFDLYDDLVDCQAHINDCSSIHDYSHEQTDSLVIFDEVRRLFRVEIANLEENQRLQELLHDDYRIVNEGCEVKTVADRRQHVQ